MAWDSVECIQLNAFITGYIVHYDPPSSDGTNEVSASGSARSSGGVTLTGLSPFTNYSIEVRSSDLGHGPYSDAIFSFPLPFLQCEDSEFTINNDLTYQ